MKVFLAGATGVLGMRLVPLLVATGHDLTGMTRSPAKADRLAELGATPVVCDVYDRTRLLDAVVAAAPDLVLHMLTDLPAVRDSAPEAFAGNARIRTEGTDNLLAATRAADVHRVVAESIAWRASNPTPTTSPTNPASTSTAPRLGPSLTSSRPRARTRSSTEVTALSRRCTSAVEHLAEDVALERQRPEIAHPRGRPELVAERRFAPLTAALAPGRPAPR